MTRFGYPPLTSQNTERNLIYLPLECNVNRQNNPTLKEKFYGSSTLTWRSHDLRSHDFCVTTHLGKTNENIQRALVHCMPSSFTAHFRGRGRSDDVDRRHGGTIVANCDTNLEFEDILCYALFYCHLVSAEGGGGPVGAKGHLLSLRIEMDDVICGLDVNTLKYSRIFRQLFLRSSVKISLN